MTTAAACSRALHALIEPIHNVAHFAAEMGAAYEQLGLEPRTEGYFAGRAAPMGAVQPGTVAAVFNNFNPGLVAMVIPKVWGIASPEQVLEARAAGLEAVWERIGSDLDLADVTSVAADALRGADLQGRPLAFSNAAVPVPSTPFAALWQYLAVLREHRGDGHVALLTAFGVDPLEALVVYAAWQGQVSRHFLQTSRVWDDEVWELAEQRLQQRGWMDADGRLTEAGRAWRDGLEQETDRLAAGPYQHLGEAGCHLFFELLHPVAQAIADGDVFPRPPILPASFEDALPE